MAQIRNKNEIQNSLQDEGIKTKKLPNFFVNYDEIKLLNGLSLSILAHGLFIILMLFFSFIFHDFIFPRLPKPELPNQNMEFKLVQNESKPPINKNTKIRSDRDSQAGGKHDPKKTVSEPSPKASTPAKKSVAQKPAQQKTKTQPKKQPEKVQKPQPKVVNKPQPPKPQPKTQPKPQPKPQPKTAQAPTQPKPAIKAPSAAKPSIKPSVKPQGVSAPTAPKIATAPKSPFSVPAPSAPKAPVGNTYKPAGTPGSSSGTSGGGKSSSAPAPKFSTSGSSKGGSSSSGGSPSSGNRYAARGSSGGGGSSGNPSPGNPNGAPGIDALKQPNWGPYMRDLEQKIKRNWTPPKGDSSKRVVITFVIGKDGRLLSKQVTKSSGVPLADRAAMSAIELTAPFRPLPPEFKGQSVPIEFTFDYNVLNSVIR